MEASEARELKLLREEHIKRKRLVADLSLDKAMLQDVLQSILPWRCDANENRSHRSFKGTTFKEFAEKQVTVEPQTLTTDDPI